MARWISQIRIAFCLLPILAAASTWAADEVSTAGSGAWSSAATWEGGQVPGTGDRVLIKSGHTVSYDAKSDKVVRGITIAGTLTFPTDKDTELNVGLIRIEDRADYSEDGFECDAHMAKPGSDRPRPALLVGTQDLPVGKQHTALIRLHYLDGMDKNSCPGIVCCSGRMEFHGSPLERTWVKLGSTASNGDSAITTQQPVKDWRVGDRIILSATTRQNKVKKTFKPTLRDGGQTEERLIAAIDGDKLTLNKPLEFDHTADGEYRGDVANLSRNVIVESAQPDGVRGHTMYHKYSQGSISYAEFRHLGKEGVLGRYSLHFHLCGDTMRGASAIGASIWDSGNRWLTIHGTNYLVVRDCVGYKSVGHGFFLEDGTEVFNIFDRNLAVQAFLGKPLPKQVLPYDKNDGSGFWWANCHNTFTRNVAAECDEYGYFFQAVKTADFDPLLEIAQPGGDLKPTDIRTLPFVRFEGNETHCQRRHGFNLGGGVPFGEPNVGGVGPDKEHPFVIRGMKCWNVHWAIHPVSPSVLLDTMDIHNAEYGIWRPVYKDHFYRGLKFAQVPDKFYFAFVSGKPNEESEFPDLSAFRDDQPPTSVITYVGPVKNDKRLVRGVASDNGEVKSVSVNGIAAKLLDRNFAQWEAEVPSATKFSASAVDAAGNVEPRPHEVSGR
jgi:hypothetical protein